MQARFRKVSHSRFEFERGGKLESDKMVLWRHYIRSKLFIDLLASIPFDYIFKLIDSSSQIPNWLRLLRLLKLYRVIEILKSFQLHKNPEYLIITLLYFLMILIGHWQASFLAIVVKWEYGSCRRFDCQTLLAQLKTSSSTDLPDVKDWTLWELYQNLIGLCLGLQASIMYGDIAPFTIAEQSLFSFYMLMGKLFVCFLIAEIQSIVTRALARTDKHMLETEALACWMWARALPAPVVEKALKYQELIKTVNDSSEVMECMPRSLGREIQRAAYKTLLDKILPSDEVLSEIAARLTPRACCKGEYLFKKSELAQEIYLVIKGIIRVADDTCVGPNQLLVPHLSYEAMAETDLLVAQLTIRDFKLLQDTYPEMASLLQDEEDPFLELSPKKQENKLSEENELEGSRNDLIQAKTTGGIKGQQGQESIIKKEKVNVYTIANVTYKYVVIFLLALYNAIFIPLQMSFNIQFKGIYLGLEVITIFAYCADAIFKIKEKKTWRQVDPIFTLVAAIPFSLIFSQWQQHLFIINGLRTLRLLKMQPILDTFKALQFFGKNKARFLELMFFYYLVSHIIAGVLLSEALAQGPDITNTWLSKGPYPQSSRVSSVAGVPKTSLYIHALYFASNTMSHVAIGDLTVVGSAERMLNAFIIPLSTFFHVFLFASLGSIFSEGNEFLRFNHRYKRAIYIAERRGASKEAIDKIHAYYRHRWTAHAGLSEKQMLAGMPRQLRAESAGHIYAKAFSEGPVFNKETALISSFIELMKIEDHVPRDFVRIPAGSFLVILEGEAALVNQDSSRIGIMRPGSHFVRKLAKTYYLVATKNLKIGLIDSECLIDLSGAFPEFRQSALRLSSTIDDIMVAQSDQTTTQEEIIKVLSRETIDYSDLLACQTAAIDAEVAQDIDTMSRSVTLHLRGQRMLAKPGPLAKSEDKTELYLWIADVVHLFNLLYIAFIVPFAMAFAGKLNPSLFLVYEGISVSTQLLTIIVQCRILKQAYYRNGLWADICGLLPVNLVFNYQVISSQVEITWYSLFALTRLLSLTRLSEILERLQLQLQHRGTSIIFLRAAYVLFIVWHWTSCFWFFVNLLESSYPLTWVKKFGIQDMNVSQQYLLSIYYVIKLVTGVGQSDMSTYNDLERIVFIIITNIGDAFFGYAFSLVADAQLLVFENSTFEMYAQETQRREQVLRSIKATSSQRRRVESYCSYRWKQRALDFEDYIPDSIANEIVFDSQKEALTSAFGDLLSESFLRELSARGRQEHYQLFDVVFRRKSPANKFYVILDGAVQVGNTQIASGYFGLGDLLKNEKHRPVAAVAMAQSTLLVIDQGQFAEIFLDFPAQEEKLREEFAKHQSEDSEVHVTVKDIEEWERLALNEDRTE